MIDQLEELREKAARELAAVSDDKELETWRVRYLGKKSQLTGVLRGGSPEEVVTAAVAVGACSTEAADATSGVPDWPTVQARIDAGWDRLPLSLPLDGWAEDTAAGLWLGTHDMQPT